MSVREESGPVPPPRSRLYGVYPAVVTDVVDPDGQGRVEVKLPWIGEDDGVVARAWARLATLMAGDERGTWFVPDVGDEVLLTFLAGDPRHPVVVGALWNGRDAPPEQMDRAGDNNLRTIKTRSGHTLTFDDTPGEEKIAVTTQGGHTLTLDDGGPTVVVRHLGGASIEMNAEGRIEIHAPGEVHIHAPLKLLVETPLADFTGTVHCAAVKTASVVSASYTVGAGNVL